jgi:hypothetical protein
MKTHRLLKLRHDRQDLGFLSARVVEDDGRDSPWSLAVLSPSDVGRFRDHLIEGSSMSLTMITHEGDHLRGEACVASVSVGGDTATLVALSGMGPLRVA